MPTLTIEYRDDAERLAIEQALAFVTQLRQVAQTAPVGTVLAACEQVALQDGRTLLRQSLAAALHTRLAQAEQKGDARHGLCACGDAGHARGAHARTVLTAVGPVAVRRRYFVCPGCGQGDFGGDRVLGVAGYLTDGAQRMACLAGVRQSFAQAEQLLGELAGWALDNETIRRLCHRVAAAATACRDDRATATAFAAAPGDREVQIDAGKVNTREGWRDVKVAVFACRERAAPATAAAWDQRDLPAPSVRSVIAAVEDAQAFGDRCATEAARLRWDEPTAVTVLGDGAEWIWNMAAWVFPGADGCLDIYHGLEHVADGARRVCGEGSAAAQTQADDGRTRLLEDGYWGVVEWAGILGGQLPPGGDGAALGAVLNYFAGHQERLPYALRLRRGQSIGSGLVEGSIKQLLNRRLKQTGARWKVKHVGPFVELAALAHGPEWHAFWN